MTLVGPSVPMGNFTTTKESVTAQKYGWDRERRGKPAKVRTLVRRTAVGVGVGVEVRVGVGLGRAVTVDI